MVIHDRVIDDSYYSIICNTPKTMDSVSFTFINCDFVYQFERVTFKHCTFTNCTFRYGSFRYVYFYDCDFNNVIFEDNPRKCIVDGELQDCRIDEKFKKDYLKTSPCPEKGEFIGWKKAAILLDNEDCDLIITQMELLYAGKHINIKYMPCIIKLLVPEDAKRSCGFSSKCRCDKAKVLDIQSIYGQSFPTDTIAHSYYDHAFTYKVGETVTPRKPFDDDPFNECSSGIHFFMSREEAVNYN